MNKSNLENTDLIDITGDRTNSNQTPQIRVKTPLIAVYDDKLEN